MFSLSSSLHATWHPESAQLLLKACRLLIMMESNTVLAPEEFKFCVFCGSIFMLYVSTERM